MKRIKKFGAFNISPAIGSIMVTREGTFLAIKAKREWLDIEFLLNRELNDFRIHKTFWATKSRCAHFIRLETPDDVDDQLLLWLKESYHTYQSPQTENRKP